MNRTAVIGAAIIVALVALWFAWGDYQRREAEKARFVRDMTAYCDGLIETIDDCPRDDPEQLRRCAEACEEVAAGLEREWAGTTLGEKRAIVPNAVTYGRELAGILRNYATFAEARQRDIATETSASEGLLTMSRDKVVGLKARVAQQ